MTPDPQIVRHIMAVMEAGFDPAYGEAWNIRQVSDALAMPTTHALVVGLEGQTLIVCSSGAECTNPVGFVLTRQAADEEELLLIAVLPQHRGRGIGRQLIERLFELSKARGVTRIFLEMRKGNPAESLYHKMGFEPIGTRPEYYRFADGTRVDAITFGRSI